MGSSGPSVPVGMLVVSLLLFHPPSLIGMGGPCIVREIVGGRAMVVELSWRGLRSLALCCVHVFSEWGQVAKCILLERVRASTPTVGEACLILGGDMDFPGVREGRMDVRTGRVIMSDENISLF